MPQSIRNAQSSRAANQASSRFLCVLRVFAVKVLSRINRQDAKSAKKSAKKNSFQAAKDFRVSNTKNDHFSVSLRFCVLSASFWNASSAMPARASMNFG